MFNLIVSGGGCEPHRDSFGSGRVLEYTDDTIAQRFMPNEVLDINAVAILPTLSMSGTQCAGNQVVHVGTISQQKLCRTDFQIEYAVDPAIRPIPNSQGWLLLFGGCGLEGDRPGFTTLSGINLDGGAGINCGSGFSRDAIVVPRASQQAQSRSHN